MIKSIVDLKKRHPSFWVLFFLIHTNFLISHSLAQANINSFKLGVFENISYQVKITVHDTNKDTIVSAGHVVATFDSNQNLIKVRLNTTKKFDVIYTGDSYVFVDHNKKTIVNHDVAGFNQDNYAIIGNSLGNMTLPLLFISRKNPIPELLETGFEIIVDESSKQRLIEIIPPQDFESKGYVKFWLDDSLGFFNKIEERTEFEGNTSYLLWEFENVSAPNNFSDTTFSIKQYNYDASIYQAKEPNLNLKEGDDVSWLISFIIENQQQTAGKKHQEMHASDIFIVDFWFQNCATCRQTMPILEIFHQSYMNQSVHIVGMNPFDEKDDKNTKQLLEKLKITYPSLYGLEKARFDCSSYPTLFIIDNGIVVFKEIGFSESLHADLSKVITNRLLLRQ